MTSPPFVSVEERVKKLLVEAGCTGYIDVWGDPTKLSVVLVHDEPGCPVHEPPEEARAPA